VVPVSAHGRAADDEVDFHLMMDAATAGELVAGGRWARMLVDGRVRIRGKRRRARRLCALGGARLEASELDAVGVRPDPQLVLKAVGHALDPAWTRGYRFCLAIQVAGLSGGTWYAHVEDGATVAVTATAPPGGAAAAVRCEPAALLALLAGQRPAAETVLAVEGDRAAVDLAHAWMERAWRGEGRPARRRSRPLGVPAMMRGLAPSRLPELVFGARRARA